MVLAVFLIVSGTAAGVALLHDRAHDDARRQLEVIRFEGLVGREEVIAWYALTERQLSATSIGELARTRRQTDVVLAQMVRPGADATVYEVRGRLRDYRAAADEALQLLAQQQVDQAVNVDRTRADPRFGLLRDAIADANLALGRRAGDKARQADAVSVALVLGAVLAIASLASRVDQVRRDAARLGGEHQALRRSEARFRALVQNSSDVILIHDPDGVLRYASPAFG